MTAGSWIELVEEVAAYYGETVDETAASIILWEYTGFPSFWNGEDPMTCCAAQLHRYFAGRLRVVDGG